MRCCSCKEDLPVEAFARNRSTKTGYNTVCRQCKKIRDKVHYQKNRDKIIAHNKEYNQANREWFYAYCREWNASNRDSMIASYHLVRAKEFYPGPYDKILPSELYLRDKGICGICNLAVKEGSTEQSIDHIIPLSRGGTHTWDNVQLAHINCNKSKGNKYG